MQGTFRKKIYVPLIFLQWIIMASLTYVCFVPAKGLVRDLSANSSNIAFVSCTLFKFVNGILHSWECSCDIRPDYYKFVNGILHSWECLCDIRPDCHHHFDSSGTSNAMFDELAERSLTSPLAGTKHTYVRLAILIHCKILALYSTNFSACSFRLSLGLDQTDTP